MINKKKQDIGIYLVMSGAALNFACWIIQIILGLSINTNQPFSEIEGLVIGTGGFIIKTSKKPRDGEGSPSLKLRRPRGGKNESCMP